MEESENNGTSAPTEPVDVFKEKYLYAQAELQNQARRFQREKEDLIKYSQEKIMLEMLSQLDSLDEGLKYIQDPASRQGVEFIKNNIEKGLEKFNLKKILVELGMTFDPHFHEAIEMGQREGMAANTVIEVLQPGYQLYDKVLRAAKVVVNRG